METATMTGEQRRAFHNAASLLRDDYHRALRLRDQLKMDAKRALEQGEAISALNSDMAFQRMCTYVDGLNAGLTQVHIIAKRFGLDGPLGTGPSA